MENPAFGVKSSPIVVPSWKDVAKGSDFIKTLTDWPWPKDIPYHLVFSFANGNADDGVVNLVDQIPFSIQRDAARIYGFTNTHTGVLSDPQFVDLFNVLLTDATRTGG